MAARSVWKGHIKFSLVSIPVKMFNATSSRKSIGFNQLHGVCKSRVKQELNCPTCNKTVPKEEIIRGYEWTKDNYIIITDDEIASAQKEKSDSIEIINFVERSEIPPVYYSDSYYLSPEKVGVDLFALLYKAMIDTGKAGVGKIVMRSKENLVLIEPHEGILIAYSLYYHEELRGIEEIPERDAVMSKTVDPATLEMAKQLIVNLSGKWDASKYHDEYNEIIMGVIKRKADPLSQPVQEAPKPQPAKVVNIMDALKAAVEATGRAKAVNE